MPAVEQLVYEGVNVNITLLFSIARYEAVAEAYLRALERRLAEGWRIDTVASVASFFLSCIDVAVDKLLRHRIVPGRPGSGELDPRTLRVGDNDVLYCAVKGGAEAARFLRPAYYQIAAFIGRGESGDFVFRLPGGDYPIARG